VLSEVVLKMGVDCGCVTGYTRVELLALIIKMWVTSLLFDEPCLKVLKKNRTMGLASDYIFSGVF